MSDNASVCGPGTYFHNNKCEINFGPQIENKLIANCGEAAPSTFIDYKKTLEKNVDFRIPVSNIFKCAAKKDDSINYVKLNCAMGYVQKGNRCVSIATDMGVAWNRAVAGNRAVARNTAVAENKVVAENWAVVNTAVADTAMDKASMCGLGTYLHNNKCEIEFSPSRTIQFKVGDEEGQSNTWGQKWALEKYDNYRIPIHTTCGCYGKKMSMPQIPKNDLTPQIEMKKQKQKFI
jgi:hypothetical protein